MIMRKSVLLFLLAKTFMVFAQTQHINQLIENVLPDFIVSYNHEHKMDLTVIENRMPFLAARTMKVKTSKYVEGETNVGLKDGYYCDGPSIYLISKDTLRLQFFLCGANKEFPGLRIGDTVSFFFVYREQPGKWEYIGDFGSHATWHRDGKFIGDFVKESMEECYHELQKEDGFFHRNVYVIDDCLTLYIIHHPILPDLPHIPKGHNKKQYSRRNDWFIGFPEIFFCHDTIAVSSKAFKAKDYKNDTRIKQYKHCILFYNFNPKTQSWVICKKETNQISNYKRP